MTKPTKWPVRPAKTQRLISIFTARLKKHWVLSYPMSTLQRLGPDWVAAQADLSLQLGHVIPLALSCSGSFSIAEDIKGKDFTLCPFLEIQLFLNKIKLLSSRSSIISQYSSLLCKHYAKFDLRFYVLVNNNVSVISRQCLWICRISTQPEMNVEIKACTGYWQFCCRGYRQEAYNSTPPLHNNPTEP